MDLKKKMVNFGLSERQSRVYLAALQCGSASVYKISQRAELPRSTCYETLEHLQSKGLVTRHEKGSIIYYSAEDPKKMVDTAFSQAELLKDTLPELRALFSSADEKPSVRSYVGIAGIKVLYNELLDESPEMIGFGSIEDLRLTVDDYFKRFLSMRIKKKIPVRIIVSDSKAARNSLMNDRAEIRQTKIVDAQWDIHGFYYTWKDKVAMVSFQKELHALIIRNEAMAKMVKASFELLWQSLPYVPYKKVEDD